MRDPRELVSVHVCNLALDTGTDRSSIPNSIQFNVVSKGLGSERMSFYLNEAAGDIRDLLLPTLEPAKAKL